jgi:hypothetical protein
MSRKLVLNISAFIVGIVLSVVFLEVALRIYNPIVETVKGESVVLRVNYDEIRRNANIPGIGESHIHQNSLGFRGADPPADLADRLSIITVGGSTTRSASQSDDRTWTALLGNAVADCFDRTWINNAGFDGHTSLAHVDLIRKYINKLHPKIVVLLIGANEIYAKGENAGDPERVAKNPAFALGIIGFLKSLENRSEIVDLAFTFYRSFRAWQVRLSVPTLSEGDAMPPDGEARLAIARNRQPDYAERLRLIIRLLRDEQTIPVLMTQPTLAGTGPDPTTGKDLSRLLHSRFLEQALEMFNDTMRQVALGENVYMIDLAHVMPKDSKYYFESFHYTDAGSQKIAELVSFGLLPYLERMFPSFNKGSCQIPAHPA